MSRQVRQVLARLERTVVAREDERPVRERAEHALAVLDGDAAIAERRRTGEGVDRVVGLVDQQRDARRECSDVVCGGRVEGACAGQRLLQVDERFDEAARLYERDAQFRFSAAAEAAPPNEKRDSGSANRPGWRLCGNQPLVWVVLTKLENSLARSNRGRFG